MFNAIIGLGAVGMILACSGLASPAAVKSDRVPIVVGGQPKGDNCTRFGYQMATVVPLRRGAFLSVRAAPAMGGKEVDRLSSGQPVFICSNTINKQWVGVIYRPHNLDADLWECGLSETHPSTTSAYRGPCKSGWVAMRYLQKSGG